MLINNAVITGSFIVNGVDVTGITGSSAISSSYLALSSSYVITSASYAQSSASLSIRTSNLEATSSTLVSASSSFAAQSASLSTRLTTDEANIATNTAASASFAAQSSSLSTRLTTDESNFTSLSSSFATTSGSVSSRVTLIEGQYATTGSNIFSGPQYINQASNAISFTSTASLYTNGGLRVSKDSYVSGTAYFNNVVVYGTSSIQYITSSQVNFGTNIITVNTDTPAVRFGGLAVFDSGSTQLTGSMLWDSEKNNWIYSNPSGSSYNSAMLMNGPRNTGSLGSEQGTTACALMVGQGGDHITSSMIYSYGNATCFYGTSYISSSGDACFGGNASIAGNLGIGTPTPGQLVDAYKTSNDAIIKVTTCAAGAYFAADSQGTDGYYGLVLQNNGNDRWLIGGYATTDFTLNTARTGGTQWLRVNRSSGVACFTSTVCSNGNVLIGGAGTPNYLPKFVSGSVVGDSNTLTQATGLYINGPELFMNQNGGVFFNGNGSYTSGIYAYSVSNNLRVIAPTQVELWASSAVQVTVNGSTACFAGIVCASIASFSSNVNTGYTSIKICNPNPGSSAFSQISIFNDTTNQSGFFYNSSTRSVDGGVCSLSMYNDSATGNIRIRTGNNIVLATGAPAADRLTIASTGIACFACQICANSTGGVSGTFRSNTFFGSIDLENTGGDCGGKWNVQSVSGTQVGGAAGSSFGIYSYCASAYRFWINSSGNVGIGTILPAVPLQIRDCSVSSGGSAINAYGYDGVADLYTTRGEDPYNAALYLHNNPIAGQGYGTGILFRAKSDTINSRVQGAVYTTWTTATDASRTSKMVFTTVSSGTSGDKLTILGNGVACFQNTVCTPLLIGTTVSTGGLTVPRASLHGYGVNATASTIMQTGTQRFSMIGKYIQSYAGAAVNVPLFVACGMANTGIMVKVDIYGSNAVSAMRYEDAGYAGIYYIGGGLQGSPVASTVTICNLGGVGHTVGTLYWGNTGSNPILYYCQGNNGYIGESLDVHITIRDSANIYFCSDFISCG